MDQLFSTKKTSKGKSPPYYELRQMKPLPDLLTQHKLHPLLEAMCLYVQAGVKKRTKTAVWCTHQKSRIITQRAGSGCAAYTCCVSRGAGGALLIELRPEL